MVELGLIFYTIIGLITWRASAGHYAWSFLANQRRRYPSLYAGTNPYGENKTFPDSEQWFGAICLGLLTAAVWPIAAFFFSAAKSDRLIVGAEKQAKLADKNEKIKELERELGV